MSLDLIDTVSFDAFWQVWPRKVARKDAEKAWAKAVRRAKPEVIVAGARSYAAAMKGKQPEYIKHASSWLNGDRWEDYAAAPKGIMHSVHDGLMESSARLIAKGINPGPWFSMTDARELVRRGLITREQAMKAGHPV